MYNYVIKIINNNTSKYVNFSKIIIFTQKFINIIFINIIYM